jgi:hypothetical protein
MTNNVLRMPKGGDFRFSEASGVGIAHWPGYARVLVYPSPINDRLVISIPHGMADKVKLIEVGGETVKTLYGKEPFD